MRQAEGPPNSGKDTLINRARRLGHSIGDKLRINNNPQLATTMEGLGNLSNPLDTEDPKLADTHQLKLHPAHAPTEAGTAGTATGRAEETERARERKPLGRGARVALAGLLAYTGAGVINEQVNDMPLGVKSVIASDAIWPWNLGNYAIEGIQGLVNGGDVAPTFDNKTGKTRFGENNIRRITPQEAKAEGLLEQKVRIGDTDTVIVTTLLPGIFSTNIPDSDITTKVYPPKGKGTDYVSPSVDKIIPMPKDYQLLIPKDAHYVLFQANPGENPDLVYTIVAFSFDKESNTTFIWAFETNGFIPGQNQKTIDRKTYNQLYNPAFGGNYKDLPLSDGISPIAKPATSNQNLYVNLSAISGSDLSVGTRLKYREEIFKSVLWENFARDGKLDVLSSPTNVRSDGAVNYGNGVIGPTPEEVRRANSGK